VIPGRYGPRERETEKTGREGGEEMKERMKGEA
jgi:hypothetical protein